ncbi:MAG: IS66 family transposase [Chitinophagales bacterium]
MPASIFVVATMTMNAALQEMTREQLLSEVGKQYTVITEREEKIYSLQHRVSELERLIFGAKSERFVATTNTEQGHLDFGRSTEHKQEQPATETITYEREKSGGSKKPSRQVLPAHLPRIEHLIEPDEDITGLVKIGEEVTEELEYSPGKLFVNRYVRPKYVKPTKEGSKIIIAQVPERVLPKCIAGPSLLAALIIAKFIDHLPLYRQSQMFRRQGIDLPDSTIGAWVNAVARLIEPLYQAHKRKTLGATYLQADETPIRVLESENPGSTHRGYHWVYQDPVERLVLFDYRQGRGREGPTEILKNFKGHLQTDGYGVYDQFGQREHITLIHCWAHVRRKFTDARDSDRVRADVALSEIQKLYAVEREIKELPLNSEQAVGLRKQKSLPVIQALEKWMAETITQVLPKSLIAGAIGYTLPRIEALKVYLFDGRLQIDNNLTENAIRPVALGRKNYLFAGSHSTAQHAAIFYSLFATCKAKNINPGTWLTETLIKIASHPINRIEELLPGWKAQ